MDAEKKKIVSGGKWMAFTTFSTSAIGLVTTVLFPRFIKPEEFGLFALGTLVMTISGWLSNFGQSQFIVYKGKDGGQAQQTAFTTFFMGNMVFFMLQIVFARDLAVFFHEPRLAMIYRWMALGYVSSAFGLTPNALLSRDLKFHLSFWPSLGGVIAYTIIGLVLAFKGAGVWALIFSSLISNMVSMSLAWKLSGWTPRLRIERPLLKELAHFGTPLFFSGLTAYAFGNIDNFMIGKFMDARQLGYYSVAFQFATLIPLKAYQIIGSVAFPSYSLFKSQPDKLRAIYVKALFAISFIGVAIAFLTTVLARPFITEIYGAAWQPSIAPLQVLSVFGFSLLLIVSTEGVFLALGKPKVIFFIKVSSLLCAVFLIPFFMAGGIQAIALLMTISCSVGAILTLGAAHRLLRLSIGETLIPLAVSLVSAASVAVTIDVIARYVPDLSAFVKMSIETLAFLLLYSSAVLGLSKEMRNIVLRVMSR